MQRRVETLSEFAQLSLTNRAIALEIQQKLDAADAGMIPKAMGREFLASSPPEVRALFRNVA